MHAEADKATRELVHDDEHPVASEHDRLASKEVHTPQEGAAARLASSGTATLFTGATSLRGAGTGRLIVERSSSHSGSGRSLAWGGMRAA
jgi:hypothetical protein